MHIESIENTIEFMATAYGLNCSACHSSRIAYLVFGKLCKSSMTYFIVSMCIINGISELLVICTELGDRLQDGDTE